MLNKYKFDTSGTSLGFFAVLLDKKCEVHAFDHQKMIELIVFYTQLFDKISDKFFHVYLTFHQHRGISTNLSTGYNFQPHIVCPF